MYVFWEGRQASTVNCPSTPEQGHQEIALSQDSAEVKNIWVGSPLTELETLIVNKSNNPPALVTHCTTTISHVIMETIQSESIWRWKASRMEMEMDIIQKHTCLTNPGQCIQKTCGSALGHQQLWQTNKHMGSSTIKNVQETKQTCVLVHVYIG